MLNNKGLVVSSVLYTLLIAFLLFLGITLANFSSSTKIVSSATKDLVDGEELKAEQVYETYAEENFDDYSGSSSLKYNSFTGGSPKCGEHYMWYEKLEKNEVGQVKSANKVNSNTIVRIYSRYGTTYWPRDFSVLPTTESGINYYYSNINKLKVNCAEGHTGNSIPCTFGDVKNHISTYPNYVKIKITDTVTGNSIETTISNVCP